MVTSPMVLKPVIAALRLPTTAEVLARSITADSPLDTVLINITVTDENPKTASDVANATRPQGQNAASVSQTSNLVFPITLTLVQRLIRVDGKDIPLLPGMSVTVEVKTGQRRAIDYVLSPLREILAQTAHER